MHCDRGLIVVIIEYFQIWNQKEHNIIIIRIINSHMGSMYIETLSLSLSLSLNLYIYIHLIFIYMYVIMNKYILTFIYIFSSMDAYLWPLHLVCHKPTKCDSDNHALF